ncbi:uncharacterized protein LOC133529296 [Cydia pomonella]|uniref:uncharacterized protein LOC133529296 n=1 Tax=Cydia pomonella TaxID=82600 RepID=UPI002ADD8DF0|nr:uncharacterized protein LOC133529296 [Cydia pomonella]
MTTRKDVLVAKVQQLQKDLKEAAVLNTKLLQEQEESEQEFERVVRTNTTLKSQLANQDIEFEDMQGQRDELQAAVDRFQQCQEIHEQALQRIQDLEQQLEESESKNICKYCSGQSGPPNNNLSIFAEFNSFELDLDNENTEPGSGYPLRMDSPRPPTRPVAPESPALRAVLAAPCSPALRALFASRASLAPELRRSPEPAPSPVDTTPLQPSSPPSLIERACLVELAPSPPSLVKLALSLLTYVELAPTPLPFVEPAASPPSLVVPAAPPPSLVVPAAPPPSLVEPAAPPPSLVPAAPPPSLVEPAAPPPSLVEPAAPPPSLVEPCPPAGRAPAPSAPARAPPSRRAPSPRGGPRRTILYSDEVGSGLGALLAERLSQGVLNNCHPGTSADRLIECISTG